MTQRPAILCIGSTESTQRTRRMLLEAAGYDVAVSGEDEVLTVAGELAFDLVILDHNVPEQRRREIFSAAPRQTSIIQLGEFTLPQELLDLIGRILGSGLSRKVVRIDQRERG